MVNRESVRRVLAVAEVARDPYAVTEVAGELLGQDEKDPMARAQYVRALGTLKLLNAAHRMGAAEVVDNTGLVPWSSRARRFSANLLALEQVAPDAAALVRGADLAQYELHQGADGNFQVLDTTLPVFRGWLTGLADHKAATALWPNTSGTQQLMQPVVFESLGFGWLFLQAFQQTQSTFLNYRCPLYVLERDPVSLAVVMHVHDLREVFASPRVRLFVQPTDSEVTQSFRNGLLEHSDWTLPGTVVRNSLRVAPALPIDAVLQEVRQHREKRKEELRASIEAYYADKGPTFWRARFSPAPGNSEKREPLRVLGITSRYTTVLRYSMAELQEAVNAAGDAEMHIAIEPNDESLENPVLEMIERYKPDLLIQISRMRYEHPLLPANVPFLCWDQDNLPCMRPPPETDALRGPTFVAGHGALFGSLYLRWPLEKCIFCHPTGMTRRYTSAANGNSASATYRADMSYVSHASATPEQLRDSLGARWQEDGAIAALYAAVTDQMLQCVLAGKRWDFWSLRTLIADAAAAQNRTIADSLRDELLTSLALISDRAFRHETLGWAARWCETRGRRLRLWGNGWEKHPTLASYAGGPVLPGGEAAALFRASTINLQIIETGLLHSRVLDGWASGGFFLIRQSVRPEDEAKTLDLFRMGVLTKELGIRTIGGAETSGNAELRRLWASVAGDYREFGRDAPFPGFAVWQALPPAQVLLPKLGSALFTDEASLGRLADEFIDAPEKREASVAAVREVLQADLSYDARWRQFRRHIAAAL